MSDSKSIVSATLCKLVTSTFCSIALDKMIAKPDGGGNGGGEVSSKRSAERIKSHIIESSLIE